MAGILETSPSSSNFQDWLDELERELGSSENEKKESDKMETYFLLGIDEGTRKTLRTVFDDFGLKESPNMSSKKWDLLWSKYMANVPSSRQFVPIRFRSCQKMNHWPSSVILSNKRLFLLHLNEFRKKWNHPFDFFPESWTLPLSFESFQNLKNTRERDYFLLKPISGARGEGIHVLQGGDLEDEHNKMEYLLQKAIVNPHLLSNRKYHIRRYVVVTCLSPLRVYLHREGYIHLSMMEYDIDNFPSMITNYDVQKRYCLSYDPQECYLSLNAYFDLLTESGKNAGSYQKQMREITSILFKAFAPTMLEETRKIRWDYEFHCFELFGLDFMVDSEDKLWLLEVNASPSLSINGQKQVDQTKAKVLHDLFRMLGFGNAFGEFEATKQNIQNNLKHVEDLSGETERQLSGGFESI